MRKETIDEYIDFARRDCQELAELQSQASHRESISKLAGPVIQSVIGSLNQIHEYANKDIREALFSNLEYIEFIRGRNEHIPRIDRRFNFYACKDETSFLKFVNDAFMHIDKIFPEVFHHLKTIHPFYSGDSWLSLLRELNNEHKHNDLTKQVRRDSIGLLIGQNGIRIEDCSSTTIRNSRIEGNKIESLTIVGDDLQNITIDGDVPVSLDRSAHFIMANVEIVRFLETTSKKTEDYIERLYKLLEQAANN